MNSKDSNELKEFRHVSLTQQIIALVRKNLINKLRTPVETMLELFSPAVFMLILVVGYNLNEEHRRFALMREYTAWKLDLPNEILSTALLDLLHNENIAGDRNRSNASLSNWNTFKNHKVFNMDSIFDRDDLLRNYKHKELDLDIAVSDASKQSQQLPYLSRKRQIKNGREADQINADGVGMMGDETTFEMYLYHLWLEVSGFLVF